MGKKTTDILSDKKSKSAPPRGAPRGARRPPLKTSPAQALAHFCALLGGLIVPTNEVVLGTRAHGPPSFLINQVVAGGVPVAPEGEELQGGAMGGMSTNPPTYHSW
eukprot:CAMPEP_0194712748 /NCGR_PEP_ID=MMETSP0296-20130528/4761_1 /TAXON_ID=39354 /ORGANISM="Heterosigma akashiwo, Strain CCMP2393" /LENGTH=105 /DNA_ID=CAMNT_0039611257 /DNA_START=197 /DNA_END=514 /DNA_ORIENTATION=+